MRANYPGLVPFAFLKRRQLSASDANADDRATRLASDPFPGSVPGGGGLGGLREVLLTVCIIDHDSPEQYPW